MKNKVSYSSNNRPLPQKCFLKGMTLVEVLLVVSLVSFVSLCIFHVINNGLQVWQRSRQVSLEEDVVIFFDKLSRDLRNVYRFSKLDFQGGPHKLTFPTIIHTVTEARQRTTEDTMDQCGNVQYYFDILNKNIQRRQANYSQALKGDFDRGIAMIKNVESASFSYYYLTDTQAIRSDSALDRLPQGVEVQVKFSDAFGKKMMKKYIDLPISN